MEDDKEVDKFIAKYLVVTQVMDYLGLMLKNPDINENTIDAIGLCADTLIKLKNKTW